MDRGTQDQKSFYVNMGRTDFDTREIESQLKLEVLGEVVELKRTAEIKENLLYNHGIYTGQVEQGVRSGVGLLRCPDKTNYHGWWDNNYPNGPGVLKGPHYKYEGGFLQGTFHGKGRYEMAGYEYNGNWVLNNREGEGKESVNQVEYKGNFSKGVRHGNGKLSISGIEINVEYDRGKLVRAFRTNNADETKIIFERGEIKKIIYESHKISFEINKFEGNSNTNEVVFEGKPPKSFKIKNEDNQEIKLVLNS